MTMCKIVADRNHFIVTLVVAKRTKYRISCTAAKHALPVNFLKFHSAKKYFLSRITRSVVTIDCEPCRICQGTHLVRNILARSNRQLSARRKDLSRLSTCAKDQKCGSPQRGLPQTKFESGFRIKSELWKIGIPGCYEESA
jgi:hypothetical protein